jgi:hypothetical protein
VGACDMLDLLYMSGGPMQQWQCCSNCSVAYGLLSCRIQLGQQVAAAEVPVTSYLPLVPAAAAFRNSCTHLVWLCY